MSKTKIITYVGDVSEYLAVEAKQEDPDAVLLTGKNFQNLMPGTYYTSTGDLDNLTQLAEILFQSDIIHYRPPIKWSDHSLGGSHMRDSTEAYLEIFSWDPMKIISGFPIKDPTPSPMLELVDQRKTDQQQMWVAGCSISLGQGVEENLTYGKILSSALDLPYSLLADFGASVPWAADQILRSDIRSGDVVFWGLTSPCRLTYWNDFKEKISHCSLVLFELDNYLPNLINKKFLTSDQMIYSALTNIEHVVRFCELNQIKLIMFTVIPGLEPYLRNYKNFMPLTGRNLRSDINHYLKNAYLDFGTDGYHPGPLTHALYADRLLKRFFPDQKRNTE